MVIKPARFAEFKKYASYAIAHKTTYVEIERKTGVPWFAVAVIHRRENPSFNAYLGNGQPWNRRTTIVPKGRGPFSSFVAGALDALHIDGLDKVVPPWPVEKIIYYNEVFNGQGYHNKGLPSAYVWGGTNIQKAGKYVADGVWDGSVWDTQPGTAGILWMIGHLDITVNFTRES